MELSRRSFALFVGALSGGALLSGRTAMAQVQVPVLARALLQFEAAVNWSAVSRAWITQRPAWIATVNAARTPQQIAALVVTLETSMGWSSVQPSWRQRRAGWVAAAQAAVTDGQAAAVLRELEGVTKWEAMSPSWRGARPGWVATLATVH